MFLEHAPLLFAACCVPLVESVIIAARVWLRRGDPAKLAALNQMSVLSFVVVLGVALSAYRLRPFADRWFVAPAVACLIITLITRFYVAAVKNDSASFDG